MEHPSIPEHARASVGKEMYEMFVKTLGTEKAYRVSKVCLEKPKLTIRTNTLKTTRNKLMYTLQKENGYCFMERSIDTIIPYEMGKCNDNQGL